MNLNFAPIKREYSSLPPQTVIEEKLKDQVAYPSDDKTTDFFIKTTKEITDSLKKIALFNEIKSKIPMPISNQLEMDIEQLEEYSILAKKFSQLKQETGLIKEQKKKILQKFLEQSERIIFEKYYAFIYEQLSELATFQQIDSLVYSFACKIDSYKLKAKFCDLYRLLNLVKGSEYRSHMIYLICSKMIELYQSSGTQNASFIPQIAKAAHAMQDSRIKKIFMEMHQDFFNFDNIPQ